MSERIRKETEIHLKLINRSFFSRNKQSNLLAFLSNSVSLINLNKKLFELVKNAFRIKKKPNSYL
jgi:hypothetical protein